MMSMAKPTISQTFVSSKCWRPLLEILESNSWRGVGHAPTPSYSKAIHRANQLSESERCPLSVNKSVDVVRLVNDEIKPPR